VANYGGLLTPWNDGVKVLAVVVVLGIVAAVLVFNYA
jgi:hypothetical protein